MSASVLDLDYHKLYSRAGQRNETVALTQDMYFLDQLLALSYDVRYLLTASPLSSEDRIKALMEIPGFQKSETFQELLFLLIQKKQIVAFAAIYNHYVTHLVDHHGFAIVEAVLPVSNMSGSFMDEISSTLQRAIGKKVVLKTRVDETLIGGVILRLPNGKIFDYSYRKRMRDFKSYVMEKGV